MDRSVEEGARLHTVAFLGSYVPRQCGIATFTADLLQAVAAEAPATAAWAVAMNDRRVGYSYPQEVRFEVDQGDPAQYRLAADFLNVSEVDVVCVQHEYGIYGGADGAHLLEFLRALRMPAVTTLHTVLAEPRPEQRRILQEVARHSDRLVAMSRKALTLLTEVYQVPPEKAVFIPHGIPDVPFVDPNFYKDQFGVEGRPVILTFGLLSPGKGIEYMIDALPAVVRDYPEVAYIVLGATHPHVRREHGESYRLQLEQKALRNGVERNVIFHNRFVSLKELLEFLGAADIYVTPYLNREQIVSGTLSYALGAGKAVVSTPYWYAEEMLAEERGVLVPFRSAEALAEAVTHLLANEVERHALRKRGYTFTRNMVWRRVARRYLDLFAAVKAERAQKPRPRAALRSLAAAGPQLPRVRLDHLERLSDGVGLLQHARYAVPDRHHGYCTDDNARALIAAVQAHELFPDDRRLDGLIARYLGFLHHAFNREAGRFRNFMSYERRWQEAWGSEDAHGRCVWALGVTVQRCRSEGYRGTALHLFKAALPGLARTRWPRPWAFGICGLASYLERYGGDTEARRLLRVLVTRLHERFQTAGDEGWPWPDDTLTYANGRLPCALIRGGATLDRSDIVRVGLRALEWLCQVQRDPRGGHFVPIGNRGWYRRGGERARFDQQPLEAENLIEACLAAYRVTGEERWAREARVIFEWFLGRNDLQVPLYDPRTGGCYDGLTADGPNLNQGAESTLAWLLSLLEMYQLRALEPAAAAK